MQLSSTCACKSHAQLDFQLLICHLPVLYGISAVCDGGQTRSQPMEGKAISVGVLCIQGAFIEHIHKLTEISKQNEIPITVTEVRRPDQLSSLDGLIIPGGESTTLSVFLKKNDFEECLKSWICNEQHPGVVWGTCAGLILLADELTGQKKGGQVTVSVCTKLGILFDLGFFPV